MAVGDEVRDLTSRIQGELDRGDTYFRHTKVAWRVVQVVVDEGRDINVQDIDTGTSINGSALSGLAQGYVTGYLAQSVFQNHVSLFEDYVFGLIGAWLMAYPRGIVGLDEDEDDDKLKKSDRTVPLAFVTDNPDRESILRAVVDRELDRLKYRRVAAWFAYLEKRAHLGVPSQEQIGRLAEIKASRDVLVHNRGIANQTYLNKSGAKARSPVGKPLDITEPYLRDSWLLLTEVVRETSKAAIEKLGASRQP